MKKNNKLQKEIDEDVKKANNKFLGFLDKIQNSKNGYWITIVIVVVLLGGLFGILAGTKVI